MALASRSSDPDVSDSSCSTAGSEVAGQHAYRGRRSEPRNYRSHHRGLGHYHFGDSDPAADLARPHREAGLGAQVRRRECRRVCARRPRQGSPGFRPRGALRRRHPYRRGWTHSRRWDGIGWIMRKHKLSIDQLVSVDPRHRPRVSSLGRARIGMLIFLGSAW
jgi:hypothetical protein